MGSDAIPGELSTLIIGGGPAGLVSLKYTLEYGSDLGLGNPDENGAGVALVEMEGEIGGTFRYRGYENAELVSSKQLTCFSDYRYPLDAPDHPSLPNFVSYLREYASHFNLWPHIHLRTKIIGLRKISSKESLGKYQHRATLQPLDESGQPIGETFDVLCQRVVICSGLHVIPNIPLIPGLNKDRTSSSPEWFHSSSYKSREQLKGKKVMVLGAGETGMDVAYESVMSPASKTWMGVRTGFLSFPKVLNNFRVLGSTFEGALPIDGLITNLFETAYVHPWVSASHLRWFVSDYFVKKVLWVLTGTSAGCNQWAGELPPERTGRAYVFLNKSAKAQQFINRPYFKMSKLHKLFAHYIDPPLPEGIDNPTINITPFPKMFDVAGEAVWGEIPKHRLKELGWREECNPDLVVLCTGYKQDFGWLSNDYPNGPESVDIRGVCDTSDTSIAFIGFLRPGVGAIPPMAEMQIQLYLQIAAKKIPIPTSPETYHLLHTPTGRIQYGVDYSTYQAQLARDMNSAPTLLEIWKEYGWFVLFIYCFGAAFPTFYRLVGPYKSDKAAQIIKTEIWDTIKRRGVVGNIFMGVIPMLFYAVVNLIAYLLEGAWIISAPLLGYDYPPSSSKLKSM